MAIFVATVMILSALVIALPGTQGREYGISPAAATSSSNIQPNPTMNTNVTWSVFHKGWSPLEYSNGTANLSLNAQASTYYANPISVNPADIQGITGNYAPALNQSNWSHSPDWVIPTGATGSTTNTTGLMTTTLTGSNCGTSVADEHLFIPVTSLPSNNPSYDWFTIIYNTSGPTVTGAGTYAFFANATNIDGYGQAGYNMPMPTATGDYFMSVSLASMITPDNKYGDMNISANSKYHIGIKTTAPLERAG